MEPGFGPSTVQGENILFWLMLGGWTFDFHDVTFIFFYLNARQPESASFNYDLHQSIRVFDSSRRDHLDRSRRALDSSTGNENFGP